MIQTIVQNNETGQTAVVDLPQSRMNMAGMLASIGIRQPAYEIPCHDDEEGGIQVKLNGRDRFEAQVVAAVRETDTLASLNAVCEMFCSLPYERQQELRADIEGNGLASLKVFAEKMTHLLYKWRHRPDALTTPEIIKMLGISNQQIGRLIRKKHPVRYKNQ